MSTGRRLLEGIKVLDVGTFVFGPAAATIMSDFGAEVIKVENPAGGDPYRYLYQMPPLPVCEQNYLWLLDGRNKKSVALNLKKKRAREALLRLVEQADVFVTNYHPSVLTDLRIAYEDLLPFNERLIFAHATGFGEVGGDAEKPGYDMTAYWARTGLMDSVRDGADAVPALSVAGMGDHPSSVTLFSGIMLALYDRERTGKGTKVSTSLIANGAWANSCLIQSALCGAMPYEHASRRKAGNVLLNHYAASGGNRFILTGIRPNDWQELCRSVERPDLLDDPRFATAESRTVHSEELIAILDAVFAQETREEWGERFERHGVAWAPVVSRTDVPDDEQMRRNDVFVEIDDPVFGPTRVVNSPVWLSSAKKVKPTLAPEIGQHTRGILGAAGYTEGEIAELLESGAAWAPENPSSGG